MFLLLRCNRGLKFLSHMVALNWADIANSLRLVFQKLLLYQGPQCGQSPSIATTDPRRSKEVLKRGLIVLLDTWGVTVHVNNCSIKYEKALFPGNIQWLLKALLIEKQHQTTSSTELCSGYLAAFSSVIFSKTVWPDYRRCIFCYLAHSLKHVLPSTQNLKRQKKWKSQS